MLKNLLLFTVCTTPYTNERVAGDNPPTIFEVNINVLASFFHTLMHYELQVGQRLFYFNVHQSDIECNLNGFNEICVTNLKRVEQELGIPHKKTGLVFNKPYYREDKDGLENVFENDIYLSDRFFTDKIHPAEYGRKFNLTAVHELLLYCPINL